MRAGERAHPDPDVPENYIKISSGLGEAAPLSIIVLPVIFEGQVKAVIELASFHRFSEIHLNFLDQLTESLGIVLNTIAATMRTEELLKQSQALAEELQSQQEESDQDQQAPGAAGGHAAGFRRAAEEPAGAVAADQRRIAGKSRGCWPSRNGGGAQESRGGAGQAGTGRKGRTALAHFEVQIGVPGEHVARAAHAAEQPAHSGQHAGGKSGGQSLAPSRSSTPKPSTRRARTCWR